jgi:protein-S-isoprenylcysteine O-methyltransferase Ste14
MDAHGARTVALRAPAVAIGIALAFFAPAWAAIAWFAASRVAYVGFIGASLRRQSRIGPRSDPAADAAWRRFRARAGLLMDNDAIAFGALAIATRATIPPAAPDWAFVAAGVALFALGVGTKLWASASLADGAYHWRNFYVASAPTALSLRGPYRWLRDPMYTVGYAHAYGFALAFRSAPGLFAAAFAQAAILAVNHAIERPQLDRANGHDV